MLSNRKNSKIKSLTFTVGLFFFMPFSIAQEKLTIESFERFDNVNLLSTHPFGLFSSRINHNFQLNAVKNIAVQFDMSSANVWSPFTQTFRPKLPQDRELVSETKWFDRDNALLRALDSDSSSFHADAVIRTFIPSIVFPISKGGELQLSLRMFLVTEGNFPFASVVSDGFIEAFHSNIKGGEDPFARKDYGFNNADIRFTDKNGKSFSLNRNDFVFAGINTDYYWYLRPRLAVLGRLNTNLGVHFGLNTTMVNPSVDVGISQTTTKEVSINEHSFLLFALGTNLLRKNIFDYGEPIELTTNRFLFSFSVQPKFVKKTKKGNYVSFAWNYYYQSPFNKRKEFDEIILSGDRITSHWHLGGSHLYRSIETHSFVLSFYKKNILSFYLQQDFKVNNNPDLQTGVSYQILIF